MPSPIKATVLPAAFSFLTYSTFSSGKRLAWTSSRFNSLATAWAVSSLSPVNITSFLIPWAFNAARESFTPGRIVSAIPKTSWTCPSTAMITVDWPPACKPLRSLSWVGFSLILWAVNIFWLPMTTSCLPTCAQIPWPLTVSVSSRTGATPADCWSA